MPEQHHTPRPRRAALVSLLLAGLWACAHRPREDAPPADARPAAVGVERHPFAQIIDAWCDPDGCTVLTPTGLSRHTGGEAEGTLPPGVWTRLDRAASGWTLGGVGPEGPCDQRVGPTGPEGACVPTPSVPTPTIDAPPDIDVQLARFRTQWNAAIAAHGRLPFVPTLGTPDGGVIALARGGDGRGQLFRSGGMPRMVPVPTSPSPATLPAPFALHPSGTEAYLLSWPTPVLRAFDPFTLAIRWTVSLDGPGQGLFVDGSGRHLLAATGPEDESRFANWPLAWPPADGPCCEDVALRSVARPPQESVVVIDLAAHLVVARAPGRYRRWFAYPGVGWLVTDREVVRLPILAPPG